METLMVLSEALSALSLFTIALLLVLYFRGN